MPTDTTLTESARTPRVFIPNWNGADFGNDLEIRYGRPSTITRGFQKLTDINRISTRIVRHLEQNAAPGDAVLLIGNAILNNIAINWFLNNFGRCRLIYNNAETKRFEDVELINTHFHYPQANTSEPVDSAGK